MAIDRSRCMDTAANHDELNGLLKIVAVMEPIACFRNIGERVQKPR